MRARASARRPSSPRERLEVSQPVVREPYRLRPLQVRVARQHDLDLAGRSLDECSPQVQQGRSRPRDALAHPQRERGGYLVVATAPGVELARDAPHELTQASLHIHVDVLQGRIELERAVCQLRADLREPCHQLLGLLGGENALLAEHARVGLAGADLVPRELHVEPGGAPEALELRVGALLEAPAPGRGCLRFGHARAPGPD